MTAVAAAVRERSILMSGPMVRATLEDRKRKTRRVVKLPRGATFENCTVTTWDEEARRLRKIEPREPDIAPYLLGKRIEGQYLLCNLVDDVGLARVRCPYGQPGDRLWVRETWCKVQSGIRYRADFHEHADTRLRFKPSIFMPRWASRLTLEITDLRVERVQDITDTEGMYEGWQCDPANLDYLPRQWFRDLWNSLNAKRGYGWDVNPWVWVIGFRRVTP